MFEIEQNNLLATATCFASSLYWLVNLPHFYFISSISFVTGSVGKWQVFQGVTCIRNKISPNVGYSILLNQISAVVGFYKEMKHI